MQQQHRPEAWLRGFIPGVPPLLQPVGHALLQAQEEVNALMHEFPDAKLWGPVSGVATVGFHLQHVTGVLDRLFAYARGLSLSPDQLAYLLSEGQPGNTSNKVDLLLAFNLQIERSIQQLAETPESSLLEPRVVGRAKLSSNTLGLLVHAAEHVQRHVGQLLVTIRMTPVIS